MAKNLKDVQTNADSTASSGGFRAMSQSFMQSIRDGITNSIRRVTSSGLATDPSASLQARRVLEKTSKDTDATRQSAQRGVQLQQAMNVSATHQISLLQSIDMTLRKISFDNQISKMGDLRDSMVSRIRQMKDSTVGFFNKTGQNLRDKAATVHQGISDFAKENLTIGNLMRYGAATIFTARDAVSGFKNSGKWGVNPIIGSLASLAGGTGEGGMTNAVTKAMELGTMGGMLGGQSGAVIGIVLGGIMGWLGGEKGAKFINDMIKRIPETAVEMGIDTAKIGMLATHNKVMDTIFYSWWDKASKLFGTIGDALALAGHKLFAHFENMVGEVLIDIGKMMPGGVTDVLVGLGKKLQQDAGETVSNAQKTYDESQKQRELDYEKKKADREQKRQNQVARIEEHRAGAWDRSARDEKGNRAAPYEGGFVASQMASMKSIFGLDDDSPLAAEPTAAKGGEQSQQQKPIPTNPEMQIRRIRYDKAMEEVKTSGKIGDVPMQDIGSAVDQANNMKNVGTSDFSKSKVDPYVVAGIVAQESGGKIGVKAGDGGKSGGITQMKSVALKDVNDTFGTNFTEADIRGDYHKALLAAALFQRVLLNRNNNDQKAAIKAYNGSGPMAISYANKVSQRVDQLKVAAAQQPNVAAIPPKPKDTGVALNRGSAENVAMADTKKYGGASGGWTQVNQNVSAPTQVSFPSPPTRNDEPSLVRAEYGDWN